MAKAVDILLWKTFVVRQRRWLVTLLELVVAPVLFWLMVRFKTLFPEQKNTIMYDTNPLKLNAFYNDDVYNIAYTPVSDFTDSIMQDAVERIKKLNFTGRI